MGHYPRLYASRPEQNDLDGCWLLQPVPPRMIAPELAVELVARAALRVFDFFCALSRTDAENKTVYELQISSNGKKSQTLSPGRTQLSLLPCLPCWTGLSRERDIKTGRLPPCVVDWVLPALLLPGRLIRSKWKARFLSFELPL